MAKSSLRRKPPTRAIRRLTRCSSKASTCPKRTHCSSAAVRVRRREEPIYLAHSAVVSPGHKTTGAYETDRARFLGRGQTLARSCGVEPERRADRNYRRDARSDHGSQSGDRAATACDGAGQLSHAGGEFSRKSAGVSAPLSSWRVIVRAFDQARARAELELRQLDLTTTDLERIQTLLSALLYPHAALRADRATLAANRKGQAGLWAFGISGDYPILLVRMDKIGRPGVGATSTPGARLLAQSAHQD